MADVGRPTVMTPEVVANLEIAFSNGATDEQACFIAGISKNSLYDYIKENPEFGNRKESLKDMIKYRAKKVVKDEIDKGNINQANWYLERKDKDFKAKQDITTDDQPLSPVLVKFLDDKPTEDNRNTAGVQEAV